MPHFMAKNFNLYLIFFILFTFLFYILFYLFTIYPSIDLIMIKNRDFGSYSIALFLFSIFLVLLEHYLKSDSRPLSAPKLKISNYFLLLSGILLRIVSWGSPPFSTDPYRYLSDGLNILEGQNPYESAVALGTVAYPGYRTIYPLLSQLFFTLGAFLSSDRAIFQVIFGLVEIIFLVWFYFTTYHDRLAKNKVSPDKAFLFLFLVFQSPEYF